MERGTEVSSEVVDETLIVPKVNTSPGEVEPLPKGSAVAEMSPSALMS